jgi:hypothetical protein
MAIKTKYTLRDIGLLVTGVMIGTGIGYSFISPFNAWLTWGATGNSIVGYAETQYYKANNPAAIKAQNEYLSYLKGIEKKKAEWNTWSVPWMTEQILSYDRAITYARIAILKVKEGKTAEVEQNWVNAEKAAAAAGWKHPDREHLIKIINSKELEFRKMEENVEQRGTAVKQQTP